MAEPDPGVVLDKMLTALKPFLPDPIMNLPPPTLTLAKAELRASAIGNYIGSSPNGSMGAVERRAARVQAVARFALWGAKPSDVDDGISKLNKSIFSKRKNLAEQGFIQLSFNGAAPSEQPADASQWRRFADYDLLYEYAYPDDDVAGLILPIVSQDTASGEKWSTVADFGRWDDVAAPTFALRGPAILTELAALTFIATNPPTGSVRLTRTFDGAPAPTDAGDLATFIAQATASPTPERNVFVSFASVSAMLSEFAPDGSSIAMGDRDEDTVPDIYEPSHFVFPAPLALASVADRLELSYQHDKLDQIAVVYLRAVRKEAST